MQQDWKSYVWLTLIALFAGAFRWPDIVKDSAGHWRWGALFLQLPTAFAVAVVAHAAVPALVHFVPYAGEYVAEGLTGVLAFIGPLVFTRVFDSLLAKFGGKE
jgi:hypothetical protein